MLRDYLYDLKYVSDDKESYFTYSVKDDSVVLRFMLDASGQIKQFIWVDVREEWIQFSSLPRTQCEVYAFCGPFGSCNENSMPFFNCIMGFSEKYGGECDLGDYGGGCVRNALLNLQLDKQRKRYVLPYVRYEVA